VAFTFAGTGSAPVLFPTAPPSGGIVVDEARLLAPLDQVDLEGLAIALRRDRGYPITVVTIQSLSAYGAAGYTIERYASEMLKAWPADPERQGYGLTLLVSADDRLARIELGSAWRGTHDGRVREITDRLILPALRRGDLSKGILAACEGSTPWAVGSDCPESGSDGCSRSPLPHWLNRGGSSLRSSWAFPFSSALSSPSAAGARGWRGPPPGSSARSGTW